MEQYYTLLSNLLNSMENISNAIEGDDTNEFNDILQVLIYLKCHWMNK